MAMRIAFLDAQQWVYTADTPLQRPFGGSQSALCYLAVELSRLGHTVTVYNGITSPCESRGVAFRHISEAEGRGHLNGFDCVIVQNLAAGGTMRRDMNVRVPLVLWTQHAHDQPAIQRLYGPAERESWNGFAFVSEWQRQHYEKVFSTPREKSRIMRNAVSPAFADLDPGVPWFADRRPPVLFYSSTPFRGLDVLLTAFPRIRRTIPGAVLRVFSSLETYQVRPENDQFRKLYDQCRATDGVEYAGSCGQAQLARELAGSAAFAYPSTFAETSCIAALEAMAIGACVLTTRLGALPETTAGFAPMIDWQQDSSRLAQSFAELAIDTLREMMSDPIAAERQRNARIAFIRENYLWPRRAEQWSQWLSELATARA